MAGLLGKPRIQAGKLHNPSQPVDAAAPGRAEGLRELPLIIFDLVLPRQEELA